MSHVPHTFFKFTTIHTRDAHSHEWVMSRTESVHVPHMYCSNTGTHQEYAHIKMSHVLHKIFFSRICTRDARTHEWVASHIELNHVPRVHCCNTDIMSLYTLLQHTYILVQHRHVSCIHCYNTDIMSLYTLLQHTYTLLQHRHVSCIHCCNADIMSLYTLLQHTYALRQHRRVPHVHCCKHRYHVPVYIAATDIHCCNTDMPLVYIVATQIWGCAYI